MVYGLRVMLLCLLVLLFLPFALIALLQARHTRWNHIFVPQYARLALPVLGIKLDVSGEHHLRTHHAIFIANHQHRFDIAVLMRLLPRGCVILAKRRVMMIPVTGWLFWLFGNVAVKRKDRKDRHSAMQALAAILQRKEASLWIFPEGKRFQRKQLQSFRDGAFELAVTNNMPVVPITIRPYAKCVNRNALRSAEISVEVLEPLHPADFNSADALRERAWQVMNDCFTKEQSPVTLT